jgi:hypothetical protein
MPSAPGPQQVEHARVVRACTQPVEQTRACAIGSRPCLATGHRMEAPAPQLPGNDAHRHSPPYRDSNVRDRTSMRVRRQACQKTS